jgi:hypothetical protein
MGNVQYAYIQTFGPNNQIDAFNAIKINFLIIL